MICDAFIDHLLSYLSPSVHTSRPLVFVRMILSNFFRNLSEAIYSKAVESLADGQVT